MEVKTAVKNGKIIADFMKVAFRDFGHSGTLFPSSTYASRFVARQLPDGATRVVEYGPGNGALSFELLRILPRNAKLLGFEVNHEFVTELGRINDRRFSVVHGDVREMSARLRDYEPEGHDAVLSGIPFSFLKPEQRDEVVANTREGLREGGVFILYQNSPLMLKTLKRHFKNVRCHFEPRNIPPYFIMVARDS